MSFGERSRLLGSVPPYLPQRRTLSPIGSKRPPSPARRLYSALNSSVHRWYAMIISWETLGFRRDIIC